MTADELGPLLCRLEVDTRDQQLLSWVRGGAALLALAGALLLLLARVPIAVFLAALLALLMALVWLGQAARAARVARAPQAHYLAIHELGFVVAEAQKVTRVRFADVALIAEDEERVDVAVLLRDGSTVRVEPRYPGLAIHELVHTLQDAARGKRTGTVPSPPRALR